MSRTFKVEGTRRVTEYVTWYVEADSFDEARDKVYDGDYDDWDTTDSDWDESCSGVDDVECSECGSSESYCECDDDEEMDETVNPNWDSGTPARDLDEGQWILGDDYTRNHGWAETEPVVVTDVYGPDSDNDYRIRFNRIDGSSDYWYVNAACRFDIVDAPDGAESYEDIVAKRDRERRESEALSQLLSI